MGVMMLYVLVFAAIVLPVVLWRRDMVVVSTEVERGVENLPGLFRRLWGVVLALETSLGVVLAGSGENRREANLIRASGLPLNSRRLAVLRPLCAVLFAVTGASFFMVPGLKPVWGWSFVGIGAVIGWLYPDSALKGYVEERQTALVRALPFAIDLMGSAMRAGLEFGAAMRYFVGLRTGGPLEEEFSEVLKDIELGKSRSEALSDMAWRVQVEAFTAFVGVVSYGTEIGASIVNTLKIHGEDLRRERFNIAERKAARAPSLMILPLAVFIMPAVFIFIITPIIMQMKATGIGAH